MPLLVFLHGYDEAAPRGLEEGVTRHGPLRAANRVDIRERAIILAPQLPVAGDLWHQHAGTVLEVVRAVQQAHRGDPRRTSLTGFSFGGNGVFDLALAQPETWSALWAVDPTRVPRARLAAPVWLSFGQVARRAKRSFVERLELHEADAGLEGERYWEDDGADHVGSAALAYDEPRIYDWLLRQHRP